MANIISLEIIVSKIFEVRGKRVILDRDLAVMYGVPVKVLNQAVKRNLKRFPSDFMYQLTRQEVMTLRSQFVTLNAGSKRGKHVKYLPYVFTQEGVAMLSSVLNSERAIQVNIAIMRAFVKLRRENRGRFDLASPVWGIFSPQHAARKHPSHPQKQ